jgi:hypothetical protein
LHYGRQANRNEFLFSRREIEPDVTFLAWVRDSNGAMDSAIKDGPSSMIVGKRRSAGNGASNLTWSLGGFPWRGAPLAPGQTQVAIQLISDGVVRDNASGGFLRGLDASAWSALLSLPLKSEGASAFKINSSWSDTWGVPREQVVAIAAGSVFLLACETRDVKRFHARLAELERDGIGALRHEGYGWISVNPPWLDDSFIGPHPEETRKPASVPDLWPGLEDFEQNELTAALQEVKKMLEQLTSGQRRLLQEKIPQLAAYAARTESCDTVGVYLARLAERANPRSWNAVADILRGPLESNVIRIDIRIMRFFLEAMETRLK